MNSDIKDLTAVILCGGKGTRLRDISESIPKPMTPIGNYPVVWHIMKIFNTYGVKKFILCLGYKKEVFIDYFLNYHKFISDITINPSSPDNIIFHSKKTEDWDITLADTGIETMTGGRVQRIAKYLPDNQPFLLTYGDAVADIDIAKLYSEYLNNNKMITISAVHPEGRFGEIEISDGEVRSFNEKPQVSSGFINGGFMVIEKQFIDKYLTDDESLIFEQQPMFTAVKDKVMGIYCHDGFWQCMDTPREYNLLQKLWHNCQAPWKIWN